MQNRSPRTFSILGPFAAKFWLIFLDEPRNIIMLLLEKYFLFIDLIMQFKLTKSCPNSKQTIQRRVDMYKPERKWEFFFRIFLDAILQKWHYKKFTIFHVKKTLIGFSCLIQKSNLYVSFFKLWIYKSNILGFIFKFRTEDLFLNSMQLSKMDKWTRTRANVYPNSQNNTN